ncbi:Serine/threonine-protein kinase ATG1 [Yarrowia sp. C11]|nr:Serine/threonine-protein kinase ATG1 [Yarrowia sp. E02]KAG5367802.1 Serine/threonine-protein kinase ATG1 [Yarrowia sp. C11]
MTSIKSYTIGNELGRGSFATVYKGEHVASGSPVAIKSVLRAKLNRKLLENLGSEISILKQMKHPHVVELLDFQETPTHFHLVMEYCSLGDLSFFLKKKKELSETLPLVASLLRRYPSNTRGLHEELVRHFLHQLSAALEFLRQKNLVHRDIKPQNLLLCPPVLTEQDAKNANLYGRWELPILKIADFGFARILPASALAETLCGSPLYMAPEILRYEKYNAKADLWSVGAVTYEMVVGKPPFKANNYVELLKTIEQSNDVIGFGREPPSEDMQDFVRCLLKKNPADRIGFKEYFEHPIIANKQVVGSGEELDRSQLDPRMYISEYIQESDLPKLDLGDTELSSFSPKATPKASTTPRDNSSHKAMSSTVKNPLLELTSPSPGSSLLLTRKNESVFLESEYVVVEKRQVEVNTLADELAREPDEKRPSLERRFSLTYGAPTGAMARALSMASARLLGEKKNGSTTPSNSPRPSATSGNTSSPLSNGTIGKTAQGAPATTPSVSEREIVETLEEIAAKARSIALLADVKYSQIQDDVDNPDMNLPDSVSSSIAEEAMLLYVKTLSLLSLAMDQAGAWWSKNHKDNKMVSSHFNEIIQWTRSAFNESLERAEAVKKKIGTSGTHTTAEKLIFDRALEMSRDAAVQEISGDFTGCESAYTTSIWMLEALLEDDEDGLGEEDRKIVERFISSITKRLVILRGVQGEN